MDTLADLASMQHHQQTARANAGGLRSDIIYESQPSSASALPNILAMPMAQGSGELRDPSQLRGSSMDISMRDGSVDTPPRRLSTAALTTAELESISQLMIHLATDPFDYESHIQLINVLHQGLLNHIAPQDPAAKPGNPRTYDLLEDLQNARNTMNSIFALGEKLWVDWIEDSIRLASSVKELRSIFELSQRAVNEKPASTEIWLVYGHFMFAVYKSIHPHSDRLSNVRGTLLPHGLSDKDKLDALKVFDWPHTMQVWERAAQETHLRIDDSNLIWDKYTEILLHELASSPTQEAIHKVQDHFLSRIQTPHATWDQTFQAYSTFVSSYDDAHYEELMMAANQLGMEAKKKYSDREMMELALMRAEQTHDPVVEMQAFSDYIDWELYHDKRRLDFGLTSAIYQRATLRFSTNTELWMGYVFLVNEAMVHTRDLLLVLDKATRHCPWSGDLWFQYLLAAEISERSYGEIEEIKHKATSTGVLDAGGMEEILKVHTAWCSFLRRRAFQTTSTDEELDVAEVGIRSAIEDMETLGRQKYGKDYSGDPIYRLEKIYIKFLTQCRQLDGARDTFKKLIARRGDSHEFWLRYYIWEMSIWVKLTYNATTQSRPIEPTRILRQAMNRVSSLDWPEKVIESFQQHFEDHEDALELQSSLSVIWKAKKAVQKRRETEAIEAYELAQAQAAQQQLQAQQDVIASQGDGENTGKRKREDEAVEAIRKKARPEIFETIEPQAEEQGMSTPSQVKRDRENATVVVRNIPADTTETKLRQYFRDCGTINSLKLILEADGESAIASIEFDLKEDVLTAQTKDMRMFDGRPIEVKVGSGSTLYVCNFPPTADEAWIRAKFDQYGEIVDVRFPSLKYNSHRRFCYVQFKLHSHAQAATALDGEDVGENLKLEAKISDPAHKKSREGPMAEGREVYISNLDWGASKKEIKDAFFKFGTVEHVRLPQKMDGSSKGMGFIVFSNKDEAEAALEMNQKQFKRRLLNVQISTNDKTRRQAAKVVSQRSTESPAPNRHASGLNGDARSAASPTPPSGPSKSTEIQSRTLALINLPDTINDARVRALAEPYGELVKVSLRLNHQGAILEFKDQASVGKASLGLEGYEIAPGRHITIGTVAELMKQKPEYRSDKIVVGQSKAASANLQGQVIVRRPTQPSARRGGRGGLGVKKAGVGLSGDRATHDGEGKDAEMTESGSAHDVQGGKKSNADFKAMFATKEA